ncbi:deazaflavin-dependent oxidoreductase (nitroreductase family) [Salinibacterium sp. CAN_S4]|uniref:nitroreductase/quinone reductase family protein n=1 Tax=Salinibacterium sp. CAN_S4 TaxID=2787727 RepID=UPI0018EF420F
MNEKKPPFVPPRWFVRIAWAVHRGIFRVTRGRRGLWLPKPNKWGALRLTTTGRRTGEKRSVILGYYDDGANLVTMAMNGWGEGHPAWWLNLLADPDATVELANGHRAVIASAAEGAERARLWARWKEMGDDVDGYATLRSTETPVVVLSPRG